MTAMHPETFAPFLHQKHSALHADLNSRLLLDHLGGSFASPTQRHRDRQSVELRSTRTLPFTEEDIFLLQTSSSNLG